MSGSCCDRDTGHQPVECIIILEDDVTASLAVTLKQAQHSEQPRRTEDFDIVEEQEFTIYKY